MQIIKDNSPWGKFRDRLAWRIANLALNHIATPWYRAMIDGTIRIGLADARQKEARRIRNN